MAVNNHLQQQNVATNLHYEMLINGINTSSNKELVFGPGV